jgi:hypothetical protein
MTSSNAMVTFKWWLQSLSVNIHVTADFTNGDSTKHHGMNYSHFQNDDITTFILREIPKTKCPNRAFRSITAAHCASGCPLLHTFGFRVFISIVISSIVVIIFRGCEEVAFTGVWEMDTKPSCLNCTVGTMNICWNLAMNVWLTLWCKAGDDFLTYLLIKSLLLDHF